MAMLGMDIGGNNCKVAVREGRDLRLLSLRLPENMVSNGELTSPETLLKFLQSERRQQHLRARDVALVLSSDQVFFRHVTLPPMNSAELVLNLPYEFRDYISDDPADYLYDYAVEELLKDENGTVQNMSLYAAAVSKRYVETYADVLRRAGFKLKMAVPAPMAYLRLLRARAELFPIERNSDVVLVDIGQHEVTVSLFRGTHYDSARVIELGCEELDRIIADIMGIDVYTASSYKYTNFEGVLDDEACQGFFGRVAMEISKVINFYNFNNPDREIKSMYFLGGGAHIAPLVQTISETVAVPTDDLDNLLPPEARGQEGAPVCALAVAGLLEGELM